MASPRLSPPPLASPMVAQDGTPSPVWARWLQQLQAQFPSVVFAEYYCSTAQSIPNAALTTVNMDTKVTDTDNAVTTGAGWVFTVPAGKGGLYSISSQVDLSTATAAGDFYVAVTKNGTEFKRLTRLPLSSVSIRSFAGTYTGSFASGDTIAIQAFQNSGGSQPLEAGAPKSNWVTIARVGSL